MNYSIEFYKDALKYLEKLDKPTRIRISHAIQILAENPLHPELNIVKLMGNDDLYRLRVGSFRVVYSIENNILKIYIIKIGPRGDVYKS